MDRQAYRVGISGSYEGLNLGDEAILEAIIRQVRNSAPVEITVFTRDIEDTLRRRMRQIAASLKRYVPGEAYDIPLRSLIPKDVVGLLVAGRCISGTHEASSSYRAMPIAMATGQAADLGSRAERTQSKAGVGRGL